MEFEKRSVVTGMKDDRYIEIIEGVYPSEKVVTEGNYQLQYVTTRKKSEEAPAKQSSEHEHHDNNPYLWIVIGAVLILVAGLLIRRNKKDINSGR